MGDDPKFLDLLGRWAVARDIANGTASDRYDVHDAAHEASDALLGYVTALRAENARLRAALLRLADDDSDEAYAARAALDAKEGE